MQHDEINEICYTIGHSDYPIDIFIFFLEQCNIECVVDVRSTPYSRKNPQFNREALKVELEKASIKYKFRGDQLGGRYTNPNLLFPDGTVDYDKVSKLPIFQDGITEVISMIKKGNRVTLMCSEKEPERCHRFALISRNLQKHGITVEHICPEIRKQKNETLEQELMKEYFYECKTPKNNFDSNMIDTLYLKINKMIAYKSPKSNELRGNDCEDKKNSLNSACEPHESLSLDNSNTCFEDRLVKYNHSEKGKNKRIPKDQNRLF